MISVKLQGRLGNQLFQYAFIYATAKKLKTSFYLDKSVERFVVGNYFQTGNDFCWFFDRYLFTITGYKNIFRYHLRWKFYSALKRLFKLKDIDFSSYDTPEAELQKISDNCMYLGFFQSEKYFASHQSQIRRLFTLKRPHKQKFDQIFATLPPGRRYVTVHVRRTDYLDLNYALTADYFFKAIAQIHADNNYYIFISDDPKFVNEQFGYLKDKFISDNDEITDLQFLINADICILSNSSFSWWGAWLNTKNAQVIAPHKWLGVNMDKEYPAGIITKNWLQIKKG